MNQHESTIVAGLTKLSMIDYPGKLAAVVWLRGCNIRCPYCHNVDIATGRVAGVAWAVVRDWLFRNRDKLEAVVFSGGEPTLDMNWLDHAATSLRTRGFLIKLDTNGTMHRALYSMRPDYVALDYKLLPDAGESNKAPMRYSGAINGYAMCVSWTNTLNVLLNNWSKPWELRTTVHKSLLSPRDILDMRGYLDAKNVSRDVPWYLQQYRPCDGFDPSLKDEPTYTDRELADIALSVGAYVRGVGNDLVREVEEAIAGQKARPGEKEGEKCSDSESSSLSSC